jgi:dipeptidyl aminopeptidase/acylaminoacyl peptidase
MLIVEREEINLPQHLQKMIVSGWSEDTLNNTVVESIVYLSDGYKVKGYLAYPKYIPEGTKLPCILWNRGGAKSRGAIDRFTAKGMYGEMARWGYIVLASFYRGSIKGEGEEEFGGADVNDIINLKKAAEELPFADTTRWGIEGWSRGGMMTWLTLQRDHDFKCAVLVGAISNLKEYSERVPSFKEHYYALVPNGDFEAELAKRTAVNFPDAYPMDVKFLIIHGGADETVPVRQTYQMAELLTNQGITHRTVILENGDHYLKNQRKEVERLKKEWYNKYLTEV